MKLTDKIKRFFLRRKARRHYQSYVDICDSYSCGVTLAKEISRGAYYHAKKFNETMEKIEAIDPHAPGVRL